MLTRSLKLSTGLSLLFLWPPLSVAQSSCVHPEFTTDAKFAPGQVWSYKARLGEERSTITILRIEKTPKLGTIVHIRIDSVHFKNCTGGPSPQVIEHAPFTRAALDASVTSEVGSVTKLPDYDAGYQDWLSHCGGVYSITVDRVVAIDDAQFSASLRCR
jgi:hypothetical protein